VTPSVRSYRVEDINGVRVRDAKRGWVGFVTYGRLWDPVDPSNELRVISAHFSTFGIEALEVQLFDSLQELASAPYFYEALISFAWNPVPLGSGYEAWKPRCDQTSRMGSASTSSARFKRPQSDSRTPSQISKAACAETAESLKMFVPMKCCRFWS
jgi:hypothetical protein